MRHLVIMLCLLLAGCATRGPDMHQLDRALYTYAGAIRWGEIDVAAGFIDPALAERHAWSDIQRQRYEQLQVTGYSVQGKQPVSDGELLQVVEIRVVNRHTQAERSIVDRQRWRWDADAKRWWLSSGLPDFSPR